jgi:chemotaxis protein CheX
LSQTRPFEALLTEKTGMDDADSQAAGDMSVLPDLMDLSTAATLRQMLLERRGADLALDASNVRKVSAVGLQLVISAAKTWRADGHDFRIEAPTRQMRDAFDIMGFDAKGLYDMTGGPQ